MKTAPNEREPNEKNLAFQLVAANQNTDFPSLWLSCQLIGLDLNSPVVSLAVVTDENAPDKELDSLINSIRKFFSTTNNIYRRGGCLTELVGLNTVAVFKNLLLQMNFTPDDNNLQQGLKKNLIETANLLKDHVLQETKQKVSIGIGKCYEGELGPKQSFQEALLAFYLGDQIEKGKGIFHIIDYPILSFLSYHSREQMSKAYREIIQMFKKNKDLKESLKVFFETSLNLSKTAEKLFIHRNTLLYRLKKIEELTGLNPKKFTDAVQLYFALQLLRLERISDKERG